MVRLYFNRTGRQPTTSLLDAPIFTVCPACGFVPHEALQYMGSRYGLVGTFTCGRCRARITVTDGDCRPPVRFVAGDVPGKPVRSFVFEDVYRVSWADLERAEAVTRSTLIPPQDRGYVDFAAALRALEAEVTRLGLARARAPLPDGVTWVPPSFQAWLDALFTLDGPSAG